MATLLKNYDLNRLKIHQNGIGLMTGIIGIIYWALTYNDEPSLLSLN